MSQAYTRSVPTSRHDLRDEADARAWLSSVDTDLRRGDHVDPRAGSERFGDYVRRWLDERDLRPRTRETYESQLEWILNTFESVTVFRGQCGTPNAFGSFRQ